MSRSALPEVNPRLAELVSAHVESFNFFLEEGLKRGIEDLQPVEFELPELKTYVRISVEEVHIGYPGGSNLADRVFPTECRQSRKTYGAPFFATIVMQIQGHSMIRVQKQMGKIPIMVKSKRCNLYGMTPAQLVRHEEEPGEVGGYFICNGIEKVMRLLIVPRANMVQAHIKPKFQARGRMYSPYGVTIRCVRYDQSTESNVLHYLVDGTCNMRFKINKQEFFIPIILLMKALIDTTDREIYEKITQGDGNNTFLTDRVELMLREVKSYGLHSKAQHLAFLGSRFRVTLNYPKRLTDAEVGQHLLNRHLLVHLTSDQSKFNLCVYMIRKLYSLVSGSIVEDNPDTMMNQDILLPGHMYTMFVKEKFQDWLGNIRSVLEKQLKTSSKLPDENVFKKAMEKCFDIGKKVEYFLATGNLISSTGLDLMQKSGYCIVAEKLNYLRYLAHFRGVHRGQFFSTMKTTTVRKLLPEVWGFMCPVHTPDGAPCGLLNHLAAHCKIITTEATGVEMLPRTLASLGMHPINANQVYPSDYLPVLLNGEIVGYVDPKIAPQLAVNLRNLKVQGHEHVPKILEIALVEGKSTRQFPSLFLFTTIARLSRPVTYLPFPDKVEMIGALEQVYLNIACLPDDVIEGKTTHAEINPTNMLSVNASLIPFSDFNQSPRNMYQCQMGKQTMGTPYHSYRYRVDNKTYRIQTPQKPLVRNRGQEEYTINEYAHGANAVVAVISYTGYDMEDAMIINKSSYERGFGHGSVYKVEIVDLEERGRKSYTHFANPLRPGDSQGRRMAPTLDDDGLPIPGSRLELDDDYYCVLDTSTGKSLVKKFKSKEPAYIDQVRLLESNSKGAWTKVSIKLRFNRNPVIGDKFSSRHGQKGVLSQLWPQMNMPFSEGGMTPDVIINPHAFPSRMTIGMLIESMAGKSAAYHGVFQDATPFRFDEKQRAVDYFGEQLLKAGFNYYGNEPMYSGISGTVMHADIFLGVVYYQRLRHMVKDKYQVRSTGPNHNLTHQPIKGRKLGGGIRLGEMERDSMLAHGASYMLFDRLMNCSDAHRAFVCNKCGSILSPLVVGGTATQRKSVTCSYCEDAEHIRVIDLPFVFRYLTNELAAMNIRLRLFTKDAAEY